MKRRGILNAELARVIAGIGHGQSVLIADAGMPAPPGVNVIDFAVVLGIPRFVDVLRAVIGEFAVERYVVATELVESNHALLGTTRELLSGSDETSVSHAELKKLSESCVAFVRTGEATPYANVLLCAGVVF